MDKELVRLSKFLSLALRHDPGRINLTLDSAGWANVDELVAAVPSIVAPCTVMGIASTNQTMASG